MSESIHAGLFHALPLNILQNPAKVSYIVDRLVEHEDEWSDYQKGRRDIALARLAEHYRADGTHISEVWRLAAGDITEPELCGLVAFTDILPNVNAAFHPVFFDGQFRNLMGKTQFLLRSLDWAFRSWGLHRISLEMPETKFSLIDYARKKLGFRFEGERRTIRQRRAAEFGHLKRRSWREITPSSIEAEWGSRRYQALMQGGQWRDVLLLSVTAEEFATFVREAHGWDSSSTVPLPSKPSPAISAGADSNSSTPSSGEAPPAPLPEG